MAGFGIPSETAETPDIPSQNTWRDVLEYHNFNHSLGIDRDLELALQIAQFANGENAEERVWVLKIFLTGLGIDEESLLAYSDDDITGVLILQLRDGREIALRFDEESWEFLQDTRSIAELINERYEERVSQIENLTQKQRILEWVIDAMELIFQNNNREFFQRLNNDDNLEIDHNAFPWSEIPELAMIDVIVLQDLLPVFRRLLGEIRQERSAIGGTENMEGFDRAILRLEEKYLDFVVGIGDIYEWGARAFASHEFLEEWVTEDEVEELLTDMVARKTVPECLDYMIVKHAEIEANNYQSTEVMRSYEAWNRILNREVLGKMKNEAVEDRYFLQYAKLVSGRDVPELTQGRGRHSLDTDLLDPESASEALLFVFDREGGILERIWNQISIEDPLMEDLPEDEKRPSTITQNCISLIEEKVEWVNEGQWAGLLSNTGFWNILLLPENTSYHWNPEDETNNGLNIAQKMQVSILFRLSRLLSQRESISLEEFWNLFLEIAEDGQDAIIASINDNFDGGFLGWGHKDSDDFEWLTPMQAEIFDLYNDIWGNWGIFDLSDNNWEWVRFGAQMGAIIIGSIAVGIALAPALLATGIIASSSTAMIAGSALGSVAVSRLVMPEGYDTNQDMLIDIGTDTIVALIFWLAGWALTQRTAQSFDAAMAASRSTALEQGVIQRMIETGRYLTTTRQWGVHLAANAVDLTFLGFGTEILRNILIRNNRITIPAMWIDMEIPWHVIDGENRFSYENFHSYVAPQIREYLSSRN